MEELSIRGEVCSCAREVSNCGERWWWGDVVRSGGGEGAVVSKKWWSYGESSLPDLFDALIIPGDMSPEKDPIFVV
ncbi:hypothetical protein Tco_0911588 [Tanacetum coccineum]|uniref:Uncharacterized protein n=1 Tax=Tanacetum coccineum TaxID=301880 RepID=A0ABQ5CX85_9ASTR